MEDVKIFKQKDLVLSVNPNYDLTKLDLDTWELFLDKLCGDREYQKEAIKPIKYGLIFMLYIIYIVVIKVFALSA